VLTYWRLRHRVFPDPAAPIRCMISADVCPPTVEAGRHCASVTDATGADLRGEALVDHIVIAAKSVQAEGVLSFSEFAVIATAMAADRLDLPGPGHGIVRARSKRLMRAAWDVANVPIPRFEPVDDVEDLYRAWERLAPPVLLKSAWGAGSIGQVVIDRRTEIPEAFGRARTVIRQAVDAQMSELYAPNAGDELIAEEIVVANRSSWHGDARYADYVSVEGLVLDGVCHAVCITERLPTLAPFVERGNLAPSVLAPSAQRAIEDAVRAAVESLTGAGSRAPGTTSGACVSGTPARSRRTADCGAELSLSPSPAWRTRRSRGRPAPAHRR
jgi:biotin carboxylase